MNIVKKYGAELLRLNVEWLYEFDDTEEQNEMEIKLIEEAKSDPTLLCLNIAKGGNGGYTYDQMSDEEKLEVISRRNRAIFDAMKRRSELGLKPNRVKPRKIKPEKKLLSTEELSEIHRKTQRTEPFWKMPLKKEYYDKWLELGECSYYKLTKYYISQGCDYKNQTLLRLVKEFKEKGFVHPSEY